MLIVNKPSGNAVTEGKRVGYFFKREHPFLSDP